MIYLVTETQRIEHEDRLTDLLTPCDAGWSGYDEFNRYCITNRAASLCEVQDADGNILRDMVDEWLEAPEGQFRKGYNNNGQKEQSQ